MASEYRMRVGGSIWHFCSNCLFWPTEDYVSSNDLPGDQEICNECIVKNQLGKCE